MKKCHDKPVQLSAIRFCIYIVGVVTKYNGKTMGVVDTSWYSVRIHLGPLWENQYLFYVRTVEKKRKKTKLHIIVLQHEARTLVSLANS